MPGSKKNAIKRGAVLAALRAVPVKVDNSAVGSSARRHTLERAGGALQAA